MITKPRLRASLVALLLSTLAVPLASAASVELMHVHGLAYSPDGKQLTLPSHQGLAIYNGGHWSRAFGPAHDYMGFSVTRRAIYSSGHPAPGSKLVNPFGLLKSSDGGRSWQKLGLEGESDFHVLATSYDTTTVYVVNGQPNSRMSTAGLYYTADDGKNWRRAAAQGLTQSPTAIAVHPSNGKVMSAVTGNGLYLSSDGGERFQPVSQGVQVLSSTFSLDGKSLWFGSYHQEAQLSKLDLPTRKVESIRLPVTGQDAVSYIAQNPAKQREWAVATFKRNVYLSADEGKSWKQIAKDGQTLE
ncbi:MAG: glycosyl hydrolase [Pseudogulbenkiania sp.]|nr:glycosyl hydrolase [Pseudogulbenkiania sp.]